MDLPNLTISIIIFINLILGASIFFQRKEDNSTTKCFTFMTFLVIFWSLSMIFYRQALTIKNATIFAKALYFFPVLIPASLFHLGLVFPKESEKITRLKEALIYFPSLAIASLAVIPNLLIERVSLVDGKKEIAFGELYPFYILFFAVYSAIALYILFKKSSEAEDKKRNQLLLLTIGAFVAIAFGLVFSLWLPWTGVNMYWIGQIGIVFLIIVAAYSIAKHHLFDARVITTELFTGALLLILFIRIFFYNSFAELALNVAIFLGSALFGILLTQSVLKKAENKERMQNLAENLKEANKRLKNLDEAKTEFISIASHQLRTPLSAIKGYISMMKDGEFGKVPEDMKEPFKNVYESNQRLITLVNDLLNLSRIEQGRFKYEFKKAQVDDLLTSVVNEFKYEARNKGLKLEYHTTDLPDSKMDPSKIKEVFENIIDNAIKYTKEGKITINARHDKGKIIVKISDTGIGMTEEEIQSIYRKFERGKGLRKIYTEGTGIGLYIANKIIQAHDGTFKAKSEGRAKGSTFKVVLPIRKN